MRKDTAYQEYVYYIINQDLREHDMLMFTTNIVMYSKTCVKRPLKK